MGKAKRESGIELLRILIMLQIILLHIYSYGGFTATANKIGGSVNLVGDSIWVLCRMPVNVFILISGYFLITSEYNIKKMLNRAGKLYAVMFFYSVVIAVVFWIIDPQLFTVVNFFKAIMPFLSNEWYFLTIYLVILFLSPFLNILLQKLDQKQYSIFMGIVFFVMSIWSILGRIEGIKEVITVNKVVDPYLGKSVGGFLLMYIIGGYIRRFTRSHKKPQFKYLALFLLVCGADLAIHFMFPEYKKVFGAYNNPFIVLSAVFIFMFFRDMHFHSKWVNVIAGTTLGIYAIHDNPYVRNWLWNELFNFRKKSFYGGLFYMPKFLVLCLVIFIICCVLELIRQKLFSAAMLPLKRRKKQAVERGSEQTTIEKPE